MRSDRNIENDQIKKPEGHTCKKMQKEDLLLYAVTDRHWLNGETLYSQVEKTLEGGTTFVQLREKELDEAHFLEEAKKIKELCDRYHVPFVINDNVDIALEIDADGCKSKTWTGQDHWCICTNGRTGIARTGKRGRLPWGRSSLSYRFKSRCS